MDLDQVMRMLKGKSEVKLVKFVSDKGPNSCEKCLAFHGRVFRADDPEKPELPIHPHCRCRYEELSESEAKVLNDAEHVHAVTVQSAPRKDETVTVRVDDSPGWGGIRISGINDMLGKLEKVYSPGSISRLIISNHGYTPGRFPMGNSDDLIYLSRIQERRLKRLLAPRATIDIRMCYSAEGKTGNMAAQKLANRLGCRIQGYMGPVSPYGTRPNFVKPDKNHPRDYLERFFPNHRPIIFEPVKTNLK